MFFLLPIQAIVVSRPARCKRLYIVMGWLVFFQGQNIFQPLPGFLK